MVHPQSVGCKNGSFDHYPYTLLQVVCTTSLSVLVNSELLYAKLENFTCFAPEITLCEEYNNASNLITRPCVRVIQNPTRAKL